MNALHLRQALQHSAVWSSIQSLHLQQFSLRNLLNTYYATQHTVIFPAITQPEMLCYLSGSQGEGFSLLKLENAGFWQVCKPCAVLCCLHGQCRQQHLMLLANLLEIQQKVL